MRVGEYRDNGATVHTKPVRCRAYICTKVCGYFPDNSHPTLLGGSGGLGEFSGLAMRCKAYLVACFLCVQIVQRGHHLVGHLQESKPPRQESFSLASLPQQQTQGQALSFDHVNRSNRRFPSFM